MRTREPTMGPAIEITVESAVEITMESAVEIATSVTEIIKVMEIMEETSIREKGPTKPAWERKEKRPKGPANIYGVTRIITAIDIDHGRGGLTVTRIRVTLWRCCGRGGYRLRVIGSSSRLLWIIVRGRRLGRRADDGMIAQFSTTLQHRANDRGGNSVIAEFYNLVRAGIKRPLRVSDVRQHHGFIDSGVRQFNDIINAARINGGGSGRQSVHAGICLNTSTGLNTGGRFDRLGRKRRAGKDTA